MFVVTQEKQLRNGKRRQVFTLQDIIVFIFLYEVLYLVWSGAYELLKAVKEHETEFHDNPNYVIT